jgi:sporulation protein YlmC with PRC-barrel domain
MIALSELLGAEVRSEHVGTLGRVRDVRVDAAADGSWEVNRLLLRDSGLAARLGLRRGGASNTDNSVGWADVRRIENGVLIVP